MKTGVIYIADNGQEFHDYRLAVQADYNHAIRQILEQLEIEYQDATGQRVSFTQYETMMTAFRAYMFNEKRNRRTLRRAWRKCVQNMEKYQRDDESQ